MVNMHENIVGLDSAIFMHPTTWKASGHLDAFNDPLIGWMSDHTKSRWGPRLPWMVGGAVPLGIFLAAMWWVPPGEINAKITVSQLLCLKSTSKLKRIKMLLAVL